MIDLAQDVRLAVRRLRGAPGFTLFAVASLALGIGVTTAIYSAVRTLLWMPLGVPHLDALVSVSNAGMLISKPDFEDLRQSATVFAALGAAIPIETALAGSDTPQILQGEMVSSGYFAMIGVRPRLGRLLDATDDSAARHVAVVSERLWQTVFHSDPSVTGRVVSLRGVPFEIVGVVAGDFHGLQPDILSRGIWIPLASIGPGTAAAFSGADVASLNRRTYPALRVWGRLAPGKTVGQAAADAALIARQLDSAYPPDTARAQPRRWIVRGGVAATAARDFVDSIALMVVMAIATLLLIACTNLANLALARGTARAQEIAVRSALGASRWRLVREQFVESAIVVVAGGACGVFVLLRLLWSWSGDLPLAPNLTIPFRPQVDTDVLFASAVAMVLAVAVFGVWPALQSTRADVRDALGTGGPSGAPPKWRLHRNIVAWQVCGSVALLLVALLCARALATAAGGVFTTTTRDGLALAQIDFAVNGRNESQMRQTVASLLDAFGTQAGVQSASASTGLPFGFGSIFADSALYATPEHASASRTGVAWALTPTIAVTTEFFPTVGMRLARGRAFTVQDTAGAPLAAIVSEEFARETFRSTDVVGRTLARQNGMSSPAATPKMATAALEFLTIVGVAVDDEPWPSTGRKRSLIFVPFAQRHQPYFPITVVVRAREAATGVTALRSTIRRIDPDLAITSVGPGSILLEGPFFLLRVISAIASVLGLIALVLAMAGLFGVLSHVVAKRTREIGVRLAIGAERRDIFRLILRDGLHPVGKGLALGLGIGVAARIAVKTFVVTNVAAIDPWPLLLVPIPFVLAAVAACYFPAARAARVDPAVVLRDL